MKQRECRPCERTRIVRSERHLIWANRRFGAGGYYLLTVEGLIFVKKGALNRGKR